MRAVAIAWCAFAIAIAGCGDDDDAAAADAAAVDGGGGGDSGGGSDGGGAWVSAAPLLAGPRQETAVVAVAGEIYVIGGFDEAGRVVTDVEAFEPGAGTWRARAPLPEALHHANAAVVGGKIYVVGALRTISFTAAGVVSEYEPGANAGTSKQAMPAGSERGGSGVAAIGDKIYVAGGLRGGSAVADFSAYDATLNSWEALPALPSPRDHLVAAAVGGTFYALGGRTGSITAKLAAVDAYDPGARTWTSRAAMPTPRGGAAAAVAAGRVYVAGGEGNTAASNGVFAVVEAFDPAANAWTTMTPMLTPRHGTGAAELGGKIYVPGGANRQAFAAVATVEVLIP